MTKKSLLYKQSKLFLILQKLSSPQLTKLSKLIVSSYFHQTEGVKQLFNYLKKHHPEFPSPKVSDEAIAQYLFPDTPNGSKKVKNFKTDLMKLVEKFLILEQFDKQESQQKFLLAQAYQNLQLPDLANKVIKKTTQLLEQSTNRGLSYYYQKMQVAHHQYFKPETVKVLRNHEKLQDLLNQLDHYFVFAKYKYASEALERMAKFTEQYDLGLWEAVLKKPIKSSRIQLPIYLYQQLHQLNAKPDIDEGAFVELKNYFFKNLKYLHQEDQHAIFRYLNNYLIKAIHSGNPQLTNLKFKLYQDGIANDLIVWKKGMTMTPISFLNIVVLATISKAFDWSKHFITANKDYLPPDSREEVIKLAKGLTYFHQQNPDEALKLINDIKFKSPELELFCLPLQIKCMFEIYLQDASYRATICSQLNSLNKRCTNKYDFTEKKKEQYQSYVRFVQQLVKGYNHRNTDLGIINNIQQKITSTDHLIHKSWLLEKCTQILTQ